MRLFPAVVLPVTSALAATLLAGCAAFTNSATTTQKPGTSALAELQGTVMGGQQAITYSNIQVWQVGTSGYGTGATQLIPTLNTTNGYFLGGASGCTASGSQVCYANVVSDATGTFRVSGDYSCTTGAELYITATGGQASPGNNNTAISLLLGFGPCNSSTNGTARFVMNELTTAASAYALQQFMPSTGSGITPNSIGASSGNAAGLVNAFNDIATLVNVGTGSANPSTAALTLPYAELNSIGNMLAACVNTPSSGSPGCSTLLPLAKNADGSTPADTLSVALNIARNPQRNVPQLIGAQPSQSPFQPTISSATDLTLAATYTGGGISAPAGVAIDASGNVWIANKGTSAASSSVTVMSHTGVVASGTSGYNPSGVLNLPSGIAIDASGNAWVTNSGNNTLTELSSVGGNTFTSAAGAGGLATPSAVAIDGTGNVWVANSGANSVSEFTSGGTALSGTGYVGTGITAPLGIAINPH